MRKIFKDTETKGYFSPEGLFIYLNYTPDNKEADPTFKHEFGHLRHYFSSYLGLMQFKTWVNTLDVLHTMDDSRSPEELNTKQAESVIKFARERQRISIDDEYYYEVAEEYLDFARENKNYWNVSEVIGNLFSSSGELSNNKFWAARFSIVKPDDEEKSFIRIPLGIRTLLEHMAITIDMFRSLFEEDTSSDLDFVFSRAYDPEFLHYYTLTHLIANHTIKIGRPMPYIMVQFITGQLTALLCEIPFNDNHVWSILKKYAELHLNKMSEAMEYQHPSFLFPILRHAAFECNIDWSAGNFKMMAFNMEVILAKIGLPDLKSLRIQRDVLRNDICEVLDRNTNLKPISNLIRWLEHFENKIGDEQKFINPSLSEMKYCPIPIYFNNNNAMEGKIITVSDSHYFQLCIKRRDQMLRYHHTRNIIN